MNNVSTIIAFSLGAAVGSVVAWGLLKSKYERIAQEEIESMEEYYSERRSRKLFKDSEEDPKEPTEEEQANYKKIAFNYSTGACEVEKKEENENVKKPYVIAPEEFGERDYERVSLTYYSDHVLTYLNGDVVEDVGGLIGSDSLTHFGEYEDDSVFVRNDELKTDFEILYDESTYSEVFKNKRSTPSEG